MYVRFSHNLHSVTSLLIVSKMLFLLMYARFSQALTTHPAHRQNGPFWGSTCLYVSASWQRTLWGSTCADRGFLFFYSGLPISRICMDLPGFAWILQGFARLLFKRFERIYHDLEGFARLCEALQRFAEICKICKNLQGFGKICKDLHGFATIC